MNKAKLSALAALLAAACAQAAVAQTAPTNPPGVDVTEIQVEAERETLAVVQTEPPAGTFTSISAQEFAQRGATDMGGVVRYEPLVNAPSMASGQGGLWDGSGYSGYNIRGLEGNRVSMDIDGIPIPDAAQRPDGTSMNGFGIGRDYYEIENYRSVGIASGTTFAGRGNASIGGGVSFATKSPADLLGRSDRPFYLGYKAAYASVDESLSHTVTGAVGQGEVSALVIYTRRDGEERRSKGTGIVNPLDWSSDSILTKLVWDNATAQKLEFTVEHFKRERDLVAINKIGGFYPEAPLQHSETERFTLNLKHTFVPVGGLPVFDQLTTMAYWQDAVNGDHTRARYTFGGDFNRDIKTKFNNDSLGGKIDAIKRIGAHHTLSYGLSYSEVKTNRPWREIRTNRSTGAVVPAATGTKDRMPSMKTEEFVAHLSDEITFHIGSHRATLTPGLRFDSVDVKPTDLSRYINGVPAARNEIKAESDDFVTPSIAAELELTEKLSAYGSYKRGNRLPRPVEKTGTYDSFSYTGSGNGYAILGNPNLDKETSDAFELGLKGQALNGLSFQVSGFYTAYKDFIEYVTQPLDPINYPTISFLLVRPENVGDADIYGVEGTLKADLGAWEPALTGFSAILAAGRAQSSVDNKVAGVKGRLGSVGPFKGSLTLAYDAPSKRFGGALTATRVNGQQQGADTLAGPPFTTTYFDVPSVTTLDLAIYWQINDYTTLNAGAYNLTDEKHWDYYNARGLAAPVTAAQIAEVERYVQPGANFYVSLSIGF
ncbi:hypothetical protein AXK12_01535 [Cephaloticoccus capnophilus]|uniref:TonB-dependent receptor n=1 Tax=Cephaloticoccus capnophilus TaxID=1548208 RepID=A0A139SSV8_9BACT|nr:TonB-dependent receptor [Cephaloticoccus capnophilus]KXU37647.1 hypothetical protein AXK12_01535 [Cephaloticoccus capnophilus]